MTEHEMIMSGVLNKEKSLPLNSFARHRWGKKGKEAEKAQNKTKEKNHLLCYILQG